jgi:peroxiredoxin
MRAEHSGDDHRGAEADGHPSLEPTSGLGVVHLFCRLADAFDGAALLEAEEAARKAGDQVVAASILGHKADVALMVLGPDLWRLRRFQSAIVAAGLEVVSSYVSLTEVSEYAAGLPDALKQARLYPQLPPAGKPAFCFYPMSKRRGAVHNWYSLDYDRRLALMVGHGRIGRTFHGRVLQLITGSTGLDDFEWGVTLFGAHPDDLKECVYQMRFDEASALYADFGPFYTGMVADLETVIDWSSP